MVTSPRNEADRSVATSPRAGSFDVVDALRRFYDQSRRLGGSLLVIASTPGPRDAYGPGFLSQVERHEELRRRLALLSERDRLLLFLWYAEGRPVVEIAKRLGISRMHCYRLRDRALAKFAAFVDNEPAVHETSTASTPNPPTPDELPSKSGVVA